MKSRLVAKASRPDETWPLRTCLALHAPLSRALLITAQVHRSAPTSYSRPRSCLLTLMVLGQTKEEKGGDEKPEGPHCSLGLLLLVLPQVWLQCHLLSKPFLHPHLKENLSFHWSCLGTLSQILFSDSVTSGSYFICLVI